MTMRKDSEVLRLLGDYYSRVPADEDDGHSFFSVSRCRQVSVNMNQIVGPHESVGFVARVETIKNRSTYYEKMHRRQTV